MMNRSNILKIFLVILIEIFLVPQLFASSSKLLFTEQSELFNLDFALPEDSTNAKLKKKVNLSFYETNVSEILVILSKIGGFNLVFPKHLETKITINLQDIDVSSAIDDILHMAKLQKTFSQNTLRVSKEDLSALDFKVIKLMYARPEKVSELLNQRLFKQMLISQNSKLPKPYAFVNPSSNDLIIAANRSQMISAENFIKKIDIKGVKQELIIEIYQVNYSQDKSELLILQKFIKPAELTSIPFEKIYSREFQALENNLKLILKENIPLKSFPLLYSLKGGDLILEKISDRKYTVELRNTVLELDSSSVVAYLDLAKNIFAANAYNNSMKNKVVLLLIKLG